MIIDVRRNEIVLPPDLYAAGWRVETGWQGNAYVLRAVNAGQATRWLRRYGEVEKAVRKMPAVESAQMALFEEVQQ